MCFPFSAESLSTHRFIKTKAGSSGEFLDAEQCSLLHYIISQKLVLNQSGFKIEVWFSDTGISGKTSSRQRP